MTTFAGIVTSARQMASTTAAEFDYMLATDDERAWTALGMALDYAAEPNIPPVTDADSLTARDEARRAFKAQFAADIDQWRAAAQQRSYTGWSDAARTRGQQIRYGS